FTTTVISAAGSPHAITASYQGTATFAGSTSNSFSQAVTKAMLTVTANNQARAYGNPDPTFTTTFSGFKNGQTLATSGVTGSPSLTTTATASSSVSGSPYTITAAAGNLAASNYSFSFVSGQLSITKATLTVSADNQSRAY